MENQLKEQYLVRKQNVIQCLLDAENFLKDEYPEKADKLAVQRNNLEKGEFSISVVGEFSAGKSTFLNALMRERILPSFTKETTATINFLRHREKAENGESGCVHYKDGHTEPFHSADLKTISRYVSTSSDSVDVAKSVAYLDLFLDSRFLEGNVTLVDTPGLNGIAEGHRDMTLEQIEKSSAGIFLFDANKPGSHSDFEFLGELQKRIKNVILVLNKIDNIKKSEGETVESVIAKLKENYKAVFPEAETIPEIWPVAAYPALTARSSTEMEYHGKTEFTPEERQEFEKISHMSEFEDRLWKFLTQGEKTRQELLSPVVHLIAQLKDIQVSQEKELSVLNGSVDLSEIQKEQAELRQAVESLNDSLKKETKEVKDRIHEAETHFDEAVKAECSQIESRMVRTVNNFYSVEEILPENIERKVKKSLSSAIEEAYTDYLNELRDIVQARTAETLELVTTDFSGAVSSVLSQKLELSSFEVGLEEYEKKNQEIQAEIAALDAEIDGEMKNKFKQMKLAGERKKKERELESLRERRSNYQALSISSTPSVRTTIHDDVEEKDPSGLWGHARRWLIGKEYKIVQKVETDDTEYKNYITRQKGVLDEFDAEIEKAETEFNHLEQDNLEEVEYKLQRKQELLQRKADALNHLNEEFTKKMKETNQRELARQKIEVKEFVETLCEDCLRMAKKEFKNERTKYTQTILELIAGNITSQIQLRQQELSQLQEKAKQAVQERDAQITAIEEKNKQIQTLLIQASGLQSEIESIRTDTIKQEALS